ncbi:MAG: hypothetical protein U0X91_32200 [Spirosomataceae bacterium]
MKPHPVFIIASLMTALFSCNNTGNQSTQTEAAKAAAGSTETCYRYIADKDTIALQINQSGDRISGRLIYHLYQKDRNDGTLHGTLQGDLLIADYTFQSEGMTSVRQVAFKKKGNGWTEGFGAVNVKGDTVIFQDTAALRFNESFLLAEIPCQ